MKIDEQKLDTNPQIKSSVVTEALTRTDFNFELWAKQVKPQMIAALQRRSTH